MESGEIKFLMEVDEGGEIKLLVEVDWEWRAKVTDVGGRRVEIQS